MVAFVDSGPLAYGENIMTEHDKMRERLLDMIHMVTEKPFRALVATQGLKIDWDEVARSMKDENTPSENFLRPAETVKVSRFDLDAAAPVIHSAPQGLDAPKSISAVREDINTLIRDFADGSVGLDRRLYRLLSIVEQLAMNIEQRPISQIYRFAPLPLQTFPPMMTPPTTVPFRSYVGDPVPFPGGTICSSIKPIQSYQAQGESVNQADGSGHVAGYEDAKTERYSDDFPF
jgi:hypothetical protein